MLSVFHRKQIPVSLDINLVSTKENVLRTINVKQQKEWEKRFCIPFSK